MPDSLEWDQSSFQIPSQSNPEATDPVKEIPAAQDGLSYGKETQPKSQSANTS